MTELESKSKVDILKIVSDHYRNDFQLFWQRTNFFLLVDAGLLGFFLTKSPTSVVANFNSLVCLAGVALSTIWLLVALSSIQWIDVWRREVVKIDSDLNPYQSFASGESVTDNSLALYLKFRPEVLSAFIPALFIVVWGFMLVTFALPNSATSNQVAPKPAASQPAPKPSSP